ncbi:MAG: NAD(P)-dependent oxidoreductase [Chitinophagaceae bacterium]|nr:NAD(P)-dependent oxidoreductase [Chitinophagaceae bacterium]
MTEIQTWYQRLLAPSDQLAEDISRLDGDILILGAGGKMGPALARLARQAILKAGVDKRVIAVSRFSEAGLRDSLQREGIESISADVLDETQLAALPLCRNVLYLAGTKFGTSGNESYTWAMNSYLPGRVAEKYRESRIVAFSTGNVYPLTSVMLGGAAEDLPAEPLGEYAQSCLGRERMFQHFSRQYGTPVLIYRLNYANDVTYGVLLEIAKAVRAERPVDLKMGNVNVVWQGYANEVAIRALHYCAAPPKILNVTGPETLSVRWIAKEFGRLFGKEPVFVNVEEPTALLSNASECMRLMGYPGVTVGEMMRLLAAWLEAGGRTINKETHFQERGGKY